MTYVSSRASLLALVAATLSSLPSLASASPWTLPQHELVVSSDFTFSRATHEYLGDGTRQSYALSGRFSSSTLTLSTRYGLTDRLELELRPSFKHVAYDADSVILDCVPGLLDCDGMYDLEEARANIIDFDSTQTGPADLDGSVRYNLHKGHIVVTTEVGVKIPMAYRKPEGTFDDVSTLTVGDDVTLGDGQIDVRAGLLVGGFIPITRSFLRADAFYNHRFAEPGDQVIASAKVGQFFTDHVIAFTGVRWAKTVTEGKSLGTTFVDTDPDNNPAESYEYAKVEQRDLFLDRDFTTVELGVILKKDRFEFQLRLEEVIDGKNYGDLSSVSIGFVAALPDATRQREEAPQEEGEVIEEVIIEEVPVDENGNPIEGSKTRTEDGVEIIEEVIIEEVPVDENGNPIKKEEAP
ncbi:MAG: hypothetical protein VYE40_03940 [Myxococcota bacterium]|nr:hypothetical protein [Myxococcota bacterium]